MVRKVYAYPGIASGDILIKVGQKGHIRVSFSNGYLDKKMSRPATYSTGDPVMQQIIENSDLFGRRIFLQNTFGSEAAPVKTVATSGLASTDGELDTIADIIESATLSTATEYPEVTTWEEAVKVLKAVPGVKVASLRTPASAKKVAALNGIHFPNYNFD